MIGKGKAIAHGSNAINYAMRESKMDRIVGRNMIDSDNPADILREFEMVNQYNYRCKNKFMRYEIGIAPQDIDKLKPEDMNKIVRTFTKKMGLQNHQWIACTHKDTGKPHIHLIANRIGVDGKVFDTTFMSNRSAKIAEEISREMGLTIANDVRKQKQHQEAYADLARQQAKEKLQKIAYYELFKNDSLEGFLHGLEREGVGIEPAKNKQGKTYGIRFNYEGYTFKASEIGREFGFHSIAGNFSYSPEENHSQQFKLSPNQDTSNQQSYSGGSSGIASLLGSLFTPNTSNPAEEDYYNSLKHNKKKTKKRKYGRQR
ncbi:MAG: relaxase/mobilization nuclease domain-containing protein [Parabacteroides sp.]|nr:relaxase/mobilization nuclease domain-containing protein [Parabacteroides sp.]